MTRHEAHMKALALWSTPVRSSHGDLGFEAGDRVGMVCLRQKKHPARFQVGYQNRGGGAWVCLGESALSWEDAFDNARMKERG